MVDINKELFKRYKPENKLAIINKLTQEELFRTTQQTILRVIKEAGVGDRSKARSKFKTLRLKNRPGNDWNSTVDSIGNSKKDAIYMDVYVQGDDTDTICITPISFLLNSQSTDNFGSIHEEFYGGYAHTQVARYSIENKAAIIKEILKTYVYNKYNLQS